jgi:predicted lipoprotein with Yx(FWY)xxD motif
MKPPIWEQIMLSFRKAKFRVGGAVALMGVALVVAACGSSSSSSSSTSATTAATTAASSASQSAPASGSGVTAKGVVIGTAHGSAGVYLTGQSGRAVYLWVADSNDKSVCSGACAQAWPPVVTTATPTAGSGVTAGDLGMITRTDGKKQVTYKGHPLYYFVGDRSAGTDHGQGSDSFGAKWWLVTPAGAAITAGGSSSAPSGGSSSGSSTSSGGSWG